MANDDIYQSKRTVDQEAGIGATGTSESSEERSLAQIESQLLGEDELGLSSDGPTVHPSPVASHAKAPKPELASRRWRIVAVSVIAAGVVLVGSASAVYAFWYQNPDKVVADGLLTSLSANTARADGTISLAYGDGVSLDVTFNAKTAVDRGGQAAVDGTLRMQGDVKVPVKGEGLFMKDGAAYVRFSDIQAVLDAALPGVIAQMGPGVFSPAQKKLIIDQYSLALHPLVERVDNQWVKLSVDDVRELDDGASSQIECLQAAVSSVKRDASAVDGMKGAYHKNKIIVVKEQLGEKNGSFGYILEIDEAAAKRFGESIKDHAAFRELSDCLKKTDTKNTAKTRVSGDKKSSSATTSRVEVWFDRWSHSVTNLKATTEEKSTKTKTSLELTPAFNQPVDVKVPEKSMPLKMIMDDIMKSMMSAQPKQTMPIADQPRRQQV